MGLKYVCDFHIEVSLDEEFGPQQRECMEELEKDRPVYSNIHTWLKKWDFWHVAIARWW